MIQQNVWRAVCFSAPLGASLVATIMLAQAPQPARGATGRITGTVLVALPDSAVVVNASVDLAGTGRHITTNEAGGFTFDSVALGKQQLQVRVLGYTPATVSIEVSGQKPSVIVIRLTPVPPRFVEFERRDGSTIVIPARFEAAYERADTYYGSLLTAEDIQALNPVETKLLLERIPGVHVTDRNVIFVRCSNSPSTISAYTQPGMFAKVHVYLNGVQTVAGTVATGAVNDVLRRIPPHDIELMEVYSGVGRIPTDFLSDACAVIAVWTKKK